MHTIRFLGLVAISLAAAPALGRPGDAVPEAEAAARAFVGALLSGDRDTLRLLVPESLPLRFGACPFAEMPDFQTPSVTWSRNRAYVAFAGHVSRPGFPQRGLIKLRYFPNDGWKVHHFFWYDTLPGDIVPPSHSDRLGREQSPVVAEFVRRYVAAWMAKDYTALNEMTYDWVSIGRGTDYEKVTLRTLQVRSRELENGEVRVDIAAKLRVDTGIVKVPYRANGFFLAVKENGEWKIQPHSLALP